MPSSNSANPYEARRKKINPYNKTQQALQTGYSQQGDNVAEALTFVPGARISEVTDKNGKVLSRKVEIAGY